MLLEAMLASLPVVATSVSAVPEVVADGETGILVTRETSTASQLRSAGYWRLPPARGSSARRDASGCSGVLGRAHGRAARSRSTGRRYSTAGRGGRSTCRATIARSSRSKPKRQTAHAADERPQAPQRQQLEAAYPSRRGDRRRGERRRTAAARAGGTGRSIARPGRLLESPPRARPAPEGRRARRATSTSSVASATPQMPTVDASTTESTAFARRRATSGAGDLLLASARDEELGQQVDRLMHECDECEQRHTAELSASLPPTQASMSWPGMKRSGSASRSVAA